MLKHTITVQFIHFVDRADKLCTINDNVLPAVESMIIIHFKKSVVTFGFTCGMINMMLVIDLKVCLL